MNPGLISGDSETSHAIIRETAWDSVQFPKHTCALAPAKQISLYSRDELQDGRLGCAPEAMRAHSYEADTQSSRKVQRCSFTIVSTIPGIINRCLLLPLLLSALLAGALGSWFHSESRFAPDEVEMRLELDPRTRKCISRKRDAKKKQ